jgi:alkyldihydroxyacetonephosphate synthase
MRWWGWGEDGHAVPLPPAAEELLRDELVVDPATRRPPVALEQVSVADSRLPGPARERLAAAVGAERVRDAREERIAHAVGRSYPDLVRIRSGDGASAPDAVVRPASAAQVAAGSTRRSRWTVCRSRRGSTRGCSGRRPSGGWAPRA